MHTDGTQCDSRELLSPCFWVRRWRASLTDTPYAATNPEFWDAASAGYDNDSESRTRTTVEETVDLFRANGILHAGTKVLDIGCGTGTLAISLAREGADVTALDFSGGMLECLKKKIPPEFTSFVHTACENWDDIDPVSRGWTGAFDLVMANMTPAIRTPEALSRMNSVSRGWCFLRGWARPRGNRVLESLWPIVMDGTKDERPSDLLFQFNVLFARGFFPSVTFTRNEWERMVPAGEAAAYYTKYFSDIAHKPEEWLHETISRFLEEIAVEGMVRERSTGWTGSMLWRADRGLPVQCKCLSTKS